MKDYLDLVRNSVLNFWGVDTSIPLYPDDVTWMDFLSVASSTTAFVALLFAAISVLQNTKSRNLSTVVDFTAKLAAERRLGFEAGIFGDATVFPSEKIHAYQMIQLVEQAAFLVNTGLVTGRSREFLLGWLAVEIPHMDEQEIYRQFSEDVEGAELSEIAKLRTSIAKQASKQERELAELQRWTKLDRNDLRSQAANIRESIARTRASTAHGNQSK